MVPLQCGMNMILLQLDRYALEFWKEIGVGSPRKHLYASPQSVELETQKTKQKELMEICNGNRDGGAAMSNRDVNAKAVRKHRKVKEWPGNIETQEVDFGSRDGGNLC